MTELNPCLNKYSGAGWLALATMDRGGSWKEQYFKCTDLLNANKYIESNKQQNCYNSIASFNTPKRNKLNIETPFQHYADIDSHLIELTKNGAVEFIKELEPAFNKEIPEPTTIIYTGRGFQMLFNLYGEIDLIKWERTQEALFHKIDSLIANINAIMGAELKTDYLTDLTRVTRTPGTWNTAANREAEIIYNSGKIYTQSEIISGYDLNYTEKGKTRPLKELQNITADSVLNATPRQLRNFRTTVPGYTVGTLNTARIKDLLKLISLRNQAGRLEGYRNNLINICCEIIRTTTPNANSILDQLKFINEQFTKPLRDSELMAWISLKTKNPAYYFRHETIIKKLDISEQEQRQLKVIHNKQMVNKDYYTKHAEKKKAYRRNRYKDTKDRNQAARSDKIQLAQELKAQGYKAETIAIILKVSKRTVYNYLTK